jgi:hypothetical protein
MPGLQDITLLTINCNDPELGLLALKHSCKELSFGVIKFLSNTYPKQSSPKYIAFEQIRNLNSLNAYNMFCVSELHLHVQTPFSLTVQADGFVSQPHLWDDAFCNYDYIGAPWPTSTSGILHGQQVGNSGFCLRSKRLLEETSRLLTQVPIGRKHKVKDDLFACSQRYQELVKVGMRFAPINIAERFSFEQPVAGLTLTEKDTFGFHGKRTAGTRALCNTLKQALKTNQDF